MISALIRVRLQSLFASLTQQGKKRNGKKVSKGMVVLFIFLYLYVGVVLCGMMALQFSSLILPYHAAGLDWLYFSMAGLISLAVAVIGTVFTTQNQLYDAKDNDLLLSMPIKPGHILLSRMLFLLIMNFAFVGLIMATSMVIYLIFAGSTGIGILMLILSVFALTLLAQAIACLLGWVMHLVSGKMHKSLAYVLYTVIFLVVYFGLYSQAGTILAAMAANGEAIGASLHSWVWIIYAMGQGCIGNIGLGLTFIAICGAVFGLTYRILSKTFLSTATTSFSVKQKKVDYSAVKMRSVSQSLIGKELRLFVGTPVYLMNMGLGLLFTLIAAIAGIIFRSTVWEALGDAVPLFAPYFPLAICATLIFMGSMNCISTPSVSLEGKSIWILKSMPLSGKQILQGKLAFHLVMTVPVTALSGLILGLTYGCGVSASLLCAVVPGLACLLSALMGLTFGLLWARLDWINEAYACKQSISVLVVLFSMMLLPVLLGGIYFGALSMLSPVAFLGISAVFIAALCLLLYRIVMTWGVSKWESL